MANTIWPVDTGSNSLELVKIDDEDTIYQFVNKVNNNFQNIAAHGGGPSGKDGTNGQNGVDGTITHTIYAIADKMEEDQEFPSSNKEWGGIFESLLSSSKATYTYNKTDWTSTPTGVSVENRNEYSWTRIKTGDSSYSYSKPVLCSHFGDNGINYKLIPSASSIKVTYDGNVNPESLTCTINNTVDGYFIYYCFDNETKQMYSNAIALNSLQGTSELKVKEASSITFYYAKSANDDNPLDIVTVQILNEYINSSTTSLESKIKANTTSINTLNSTVSKLSSTKADQSSIDSLNTSIDSLNDSLNTSIDSLNTSIDSLNTKLAEKASQADLDSLKEKVENININDDTDNSDYLTYDFLKNNGITLGDNTATNDSIKINATDINIASSSTTNGIDIYSKKNINTISENLLNILSYNDIQINTKYNGIYITSDKNLYIAEFDSNANTRLYSSFNRRKIKIISGDLNIGKNEDKNPYDMYIVNADKTINIYLYTTYILPGTNFIFKGVTGQTFKLNTKDSYILKTDGKTSSDITSLPHNTIVHVTYLGYIGEKKYWLILEN